MSTATKQRTLLEVGPRRLKFAKTPRREETEIGKYRHWYARGEDLFHAGDLEGHAVRPCDEETRILGRRRKRSIS